MISNEIERIQANNERLKTNIASAYSKAEEKGATLPEVKNSANLANTIESITGGSSEEEWQPQPDWWDIDSILENDTEEYAGKVIMLLRDTSDRMELFGDSFSNLAKVVLSDGTEYKNLSNGFVHNWNNSNDKECSLGYKTRYAIFYFSTDTTILTNNDQTSWLRNFAPITIYAIFKNLKITSWNMTRTFNALKICESLKFLNCGIYNFEFTQPCFKKIYFDEMCVWTNPSTALNGKFYGARNMYTNNIQKLYDFIYTDSNTNCARLFSDCLKLKEIDLKSTINVTSFQQTFSSCYSLEKVKNIDTSNATTLSSTFSNCSSIEYFENCNLNLENAVSLDSAFNSCFLLNEINFKNLGSKATNINAMFNQCFALKTLGILNTVNVTNFQNAFNGCYSLKSIDYIDFYSATNITNVFLNCFALEEIFGIKNIKISGLSFKDCPLSHDTLIRVRNACADYSAGDTHTINIGATNIAKLTDDELAEWQNKNWTIS